MKEIKIAVLVSGGGTNLQALINAQGKVLKSGRIGLVLSDNPSAYALTRAKEAGIPCEAINRKDFSSKEEFEGALIGRLANCGAELIILAGFMRVLSEKFVKAFEGRIINVHPSLIPSFCGNGFYGLKVHEAALSYGVKVTGATVHYVNEVTDGGKIILQKAVPVRKGDTAETLQKRVMEKAEWIILPRAAELVCRKLLKTREVLK